MSHTVHNSSSPYRASEALKVLRERFHAGKIGPDELETVLKRNHIAPEGGKSISPAQRSETFSHIIGRFNIPEASYESDLIDAVLKQFDIEYFYAPKGLSSLEIKESYRNRSTDYKEYLEKEIERLKPDPDQDDQTKTRISVLEKRLEEAKSKTEKISPKLDEKITADENGHNLHHVFVLVDKNTGEKYLFGQDDLKTLFSSEDLTIERAIVTHLMRKRVLDVNLQKDKLEQLKKVLLIKPDERDAYLKSIKGLQEVSNAEFSDSHFQESDTVISLFREVWDAHWKSDPRKKDDAWLEKYSLENTLTAIKEITHIKDEEAILGLLPNNVTRNTVGKHLQFTRLNRPEDLKSENIEFLVDSFNALKQAQSIISEEASDVKGDKEKDSRFALGTTEGQAILYVADRLLKTVTGDSTVLNVSLSGPSQLVSVLSGKTPDITNQITDLDRKQYPPDKPHPNKNLITGDVRDSALTIDKKYDVVIANSIFHKLSGKKSAVINTILNLRKAMKKGSRLVLTMPPNHQISKNNLEHLFRIVGFKAVMPPEIKRNSSTLYKDTAPDNTAGRNLVDKPFEYSEYELEIERDLKEIETSLNVLPDDFFSTKNPSTRNQYGERDIEPEFILRADYLNALALLQADDAVNKFDATSASPVSRADIIKNHEGVFEENLAALQFFSGSFPSGIDLLTIHEKNILTGVLHAYDENLSPTMTSTQVNFVLNYPSLKQVSVSDLPENVRGSFTASTCTILEAYTAIKAQKADGDLSLEIRPRRALHEKIRDAFDKRLAKFEEFPHVELIHPTDNDEVVRRLEVVQLPTQQTEEIIAPGGSLVALKDMIGNGPYDNCSLTVVMMDKCHFFHPSNIISHNDLISYFTENDKFSSRLNAFIENRRIPLLYLELAMNPTYIRDSERRIDGLLAGTATPYKEEIEKLAKSLGVTPTTLDPDYDSRVSIRTVTLKCPLSDKEFTTTANADGNFNKREIVDFVEEALASLEYVNSLGYIQGNNLIVFNQIKAKWDENFETLNLTDIENLDQLLDQIVIIPGGAAETSSIRDVANYKNTSETASGEKPLVEGFRINLPNRIGHAWTKKTSTIDMSKIEDTAYFINSLKSIGKKEPEHQPTNDRNDPKKAFVIAIFGTLANGDTAFFAPRRLMDPKDLAGHFSSYMSLFERLGALEYNENYSVQGFISKLTQKLLGNGPTQNFDLADRIIRNINQKNFTPEVVEELASFFEVSPEDIDPNYQPMTSVVASASPTPPPPSGSSTAGAFNALQAQNIKDAKLIAEQGEIFRPLNSMSLSKRCELYKALPENIDKRDLNETILVEMFLAIVEEMPNKGILNDPYNAIKKEWDEEFKLTLSKENRTYIANYLNMGALNAFEAMERGRARSYLFSRSLLNTRIEDEMRKRLALIPGKNITIGLPPSTLFSQTGFRCANQPLAGQSRIMLHKDQTGLKYDLSEIIENSHLAKLFTPLISLRVRVGALATNSNINLERAHISRIPALISASEICHATREPKAGEIEAIAKFFRVSPTDIDPKYSSSTPQTFTEALKNTALNLEGDDATLLTNIRNIKISDKSGLSKITAHQVYEIIDRFKAGKQNAIGQYLVQERFYRQTTQANTMTTEIQKVIKKYLIENKGVSIR